LGALGAVAALVRARFSFLFLIAGMMLTASSMGRNVAPAGIIVVPVALAALMNSPKKRPDAVSFRVRLGDGARLLLGVVVLGLSIFWSSQIVSNRFYDVGNSYVRFGLGISRTSLPLGAADWITRHLDDPRIWCDTNSSSTLRFFTRPKPLLPILTNQWAYPPAVMDENQRLRAASTSARLFSALARSSKWALVHVEGEHAVLLRTEGPTAELAAEHDLADFDGDPQAYVREQRALDPLVYRSLIPAGRCLLEGGATGLAIPVLEAAALEITDSPWLWSTIASAYASRADARRMAGEPGYIDDFQVARSHFQQALDIQPDYEFAQRTLARVEEMIAGSSD
jgi:hypothetical protein